MSRFKPNLHLIQQELRLSIWQLSRHIFEGVSKLGPNEVESNTITLGDTILRAGVLD